ncbi:MAG TPA: gluconate 2-dehydrogenase subunit 3 family protein [Chitinophagaceae bacterium]|nr:gluconate 2-dehydrogenase subunit 3 family protein [Chitinophagaceae bacterium]
MDRREAIQRVTVLLGGTILGANAFLTGCKPADEKTGETFTDKDIAMLDEIAETIIPATNTPGAKAAKVGAFMTVMVNDCYEEKDQKEFKQGLNKIREASDKKYDKSFMEISSQQRLELLTGLDAEQKQAAEKQKQDPKDDYQKHYFRMMKELTLLGYFTSEIGQTQALRYEPVPGRYEGCVPYKKGDRAWA